MSDSNFETAVLNAAKSSVVKLFEQGLLMPDYANRVKIPPALVEQVYQLIDWNSVLEILRPKINELVAVKITHAMSEELTGDVKRVLSHEPTRLRLRNLVACELDKIRSESAQR